MFLSCFPTCLDTSFRPLLGNCISKLIVLVGLLALRKACSRPLSRNRISKSLYNHTKRLAMAKFPSPLGESHFQMSLTLHILSDLPERFAWENSLQTELFSPTFLRSIQIPPSFSHFYPNYNIIFESCNLFYCSINYIIHLFLQGNIFMRIRQNLIVDINPGTIPHCNAAESRFQARKDAEDSKIKKPLKSRRI